MAPLSNGAHRTREELEAVLEQIRAAPPDAGPLLRIVRRPRPGERETLAAGRLDLAEGLAGDGWSRRGGRRGPDPETQLTLMGSLVADVVARSPERWGLAGDQLYVDLDLSEQNLPAGTQPGAIAVGDLVRKHRPA